MTKVIVAMSGGVDSSMAAALLKKGGFNTTGFFMRLADLSRFKESEVRARKIAKILRIPFLSLDLRKEFKKRIIDHFLEGHKKGLTPNPCVVCNKEIKFGLLLEKALKLNADYIATGHYALKREIKNQKSPKESLRDPTGQAKIKNYLLLKAKDKKKDQSYFLWMLNQEQLKRILFPIGNYGRAEIKKLAKKFKLSLLLNVPKSTEICFVQTTINSVRGQRGLTERQKKQTSNGVNDFLKKYLKEKPGRVICSSPGDEQKVLGEHRGLWFYTIGQRKGIGLAGGPYWVLDKDIKNNLLIVTKNEKDLYKKELVAKNVNWISGREPRLPLKVMAKIRYRHQSALATLTYNLKLKTYNLKFEKTQRAITPGQSVVFYRGEELLGGGIIC